MSCSIIAIPWGLYSIVMAITGTGWVVATMREVNKFAEAFESEDDLLMAGSLSKEDMQQHYSIDAEQFIEREYETPFMDKEILMKTLEEHGVMELEETLNGEITGKVDTFSLKFSKPSAEEPYKLKIYCPEGDSADEKVNDVSSEYALNMQEAAYISIIEKLKENNMQIEEETVEDDNTIVLTINLEQ